MLAVNERMRHVPLPKTAEYLMISGEPDKCVSYRMQDARGPRVAGAPVVHGLVRCSAAPGDPCGAEINAPAGEPRVPLIVTLLLMLPIGLVLWALLLMWALPSLAELVSRVWGVLLHVGAGHGA